MDWHFDGTLAHYVSRDQYRLPSVLFATILLLTAVTETAARYLQVQFSAVEIHPDARVVWRPLAEAVLRGNPLYVREAVDNKPPLFEFLNIAVAGTGEYVAVFLLLVGLANGFTAILLWQLLTHHHHNLLGALAACIFLIAAPLVKGHAINVRSFAILGMLLALSCDRAVLRGGLVACATLFSQYSIIIAPVLIYDGFKSSLTHSRRRGYQWMIWFSISAIGVGVGSFGLLYVLWGSESLIAGLYQSFGVAGRYFTVYGPSLWVNTDVWATYTLRAITPLLPILFVATLGAIITIRILYLNYNSKTQIQQTQIEIQALGLALLFGSLIFVRPLPTYWMYSLPWIAALAAVGIDRLGNIYSQWHGI